MSIFLLLILFTDFNIRIYDGVELACRRLVALG